MTVLDRPDPAEPGPGEVLLAPEAVGICGSDYHFFAGELSEAAGGSQFPRVQGHEVAARSRRSGADCRPELAIGQRVALCPLRACGRLLPVQRRAAEHVRQLRADRDPRRRRAAGAAGGTARIRCFRSGIDDPAIAAMAEPVSIAVRAVHRAAIQPGERVVVLGAGPIGQCVCVVARERGADVLMIDLSGPPARAGPRDRSRRLAVDYPGRGACGGRGAGRAAAARRWCSTPPACPPPSARWSRWSPRRGVPCRSACRATR